MDSTSITPMFSASYQYTVVTQIIDRFTFETGVDYLNISYVVVGSIGFLLNLFIFIILITNRSSNRHFTETLMIIQVVIDCITGLYVTIIKLSKPTSIYFHESLSDWLYCKVIGSQFIEMSLLMTSIYNLLNIILFQYFEVVFPTTKFTQWWKKHPFVVIIWPWIYCFAFHFYLDVLHAAIKDHVCYAVADWPDEATFKGSIVYLYLANCIFPIVLFIGILSRMVQRLGKKPNAIGNEVGVVFRSARLNMLRTIVALFIGYVICVVPGHTLTLLAVMQAISYYWMQSPIFLFSISLYFSNIIINPFIFGLQYRHFKIGIKRLHRRCTAKIQPTPPITYHSSNEMMATEYK